MENKEYFKRYEVTEDGVSPRVIPGVKNGIHHVTGVEHDETGKPSEGAVNRNLKWINGLEKWKIFNLIHLFIKMHHMKKQICYLLVLIQLVESIEEAMERLEKDGVKVNHAHIRLIHPFPTDELLPLVENAKKVAVVENNATGQLANIIKMNVGHA